MTEKHFTQCIVPGCASTACRDKGTICEAHYMRMRRNGSYDRKSTFLSGPLTQSGGGYLLDYAPDHPLRAGSSPRVYQHRIVYYDANGVGPFSCHCCGKEVAWDDLHIDHLNDVVTDNRIENLAPACPVCNQARGRHKMIEKSRANGVVLTANGLSMCKSEWARYLKLSINSIDSRLRHGESLEMALTPRRVGSPGPKSIRYPDQQACS